MAQTLEALNEGLDDDFREVIQHLQQIFVGGATKFHGRATHTYGVGARGEARIVVPDTFPQNDFLTAGKTYPVILRHSQPGGQPDNRTRDGAASSLKFFEGPADASARGLHDVTMNTGRTLFVRSARAFLSMVTTPNAQRVEKLLIPGILEDRILSEGYRNGGSFTDFYYHSQICFELKSQAGPGSYLRFRLINGDRGPERGRYPVSWEPKGITFYPVLDDDPRSATFLKDDFLMRLRHGAVNYLLQGQLRPMGELEAVNCTRVWDPEVYPWVDLAQIKLTEPLTIEELDVLAFDANWTASGIDLPLATTGLWEGKQADNHASLGHVRSLVYALARKARADSPKPHVN